MLLNIAKASLGPAIEKTKTMTVNLISRDTHVGAQQEAEAFARRAHWDRPSSWTRVLAGRASAPYLQAMVVAGASASRDNAYAWRVLHEAQAARAEALHMLPSPAQTQALETAQLGDDSELLAMARARRRVRTLLERSARLEGEARLYFERSQAAGASTARWQAAGSAAAARTAHAYHLEDRGPQL